MERAPWEQEELDAAYEAIKDDEERKRDRYARAIANGCLTPNEVRAIESGGRR